MKKMIDSDLDSDLNELKRFWDESPENKVKVIMGFFVVSTATIFASLFFI